MPLKQRLLQTWHRFLQTNFNIYFRSAPPIGKQRLYKHVDIQQSFEQFEKNRKQQRLQLQEYKQQVKKSILQKELKLLEKLNKQEITIIDSEKKLNYENSLNQEILNRIQQIKEEPLVKSEGNQQRQEEIKKQLSQIEASLNELKKERDELQSIESNLVELEPDYILLSSIEKKIVMNMITYYEFQTRHIAGVSLNPETIKAMEIVHYHVQNNLPIKRDLLYEIVPELFETEIGELSEYKQKMIDEKRPKFITDQGSIVRVIAKNSKLEDKKDNIDGIVKEKKNFNLVLEQLRVQELEMMGFLYRKAQEFCEKHDDYMEMKFAQGIPTERMIIDSVFNKKDEELTEQDKLFKQEYLALKKINDDYHDLLELNKVKAAKEQRELYVPEFVKQNERLHKAWIEKWEQIVQNSFDFSESRLLPRNDYESQLDKVILDYRKKDIESLIKESTEEYKTNLGGNMPLRQDRIQKDEKLVNKMKVMADLMHSLPSQEELNDQKKRKMIESMTIDENFALRHTEEEGRIMMEQLPRVLFLNNTDPKKFDLIFWAKHFNIEPQKLRNIFNYVSYPIIANSQKETSRILRFIIFNEKAETQQVTTEVKQQLNKPS